MNVVLRAIAILSLTLPIAAWSQETTTPPPQEELPVNHQVVLAGDIVTGILPLVAFGKAWLGEDGNEGMKQWALSTAIDEAVLTLARVGFNQTSWGERPNGGSYGFPSGHAGFVYSQSAFLQYRYGWTWGVPSFLVASGVGYIRVREHKHHWRDIIAGGVMSYALSWPTVSRYTGGGTVTPVVGPDALGIEYEKTFGANP